MKLAPLSGHLGGLALPICGGFLALFAVSLVVAFFANAKPAHASVSQPVQFNHQKHTEDAGLECATCHPLFSHETSSGLPSTAACALCHLEPQGESPEENRLVEILQSGGELEWGLIFRQPPNVFFSHRLHVVVAELECTECHGDIGTSAAPPDRAIPLRMDQCLQCHETRSASTDCSACHR